MASVLDYANPTRFLNFARIVLPWLTGSTLLLLVIGLYGAFTAPPDYQQGETVRIMYIHVPSAWLALFAYVVMTSAALGVLVWKHPLADAAQKTAAGLGAAFTFVCLVTGSLWGRPMWGTYWVWDARLTSVLVMFLIYVAYIALRASLDDETRAARAGAILALVGAINLPVVKFSVDWWNTLHQGAAVFRAEGPSLAPVYLWPLLIMALAYMAAFGSLWLVAIRAEVWRRRAEAAALRAARA